MTWRLEPGPKLVSDEYGPSHNFTPGEFAAQQWPDCPKCGTTIEVDAIDASSRLGNRRVFLAGRVHCPRGCNPKEWQL